MRIRAACFGQLTVPEDSFIFSFWRLPRREILGFLYKEIGPIFRALVFYDLSGLSFLDF